MLFESSPTEALEIFGCAKLDEAFLKLCEAPLNEENIEKVEDFAPDQPRFKNTSNTVLSMRRLKALIIRNFIQNCRRFLTCR